MGNWPRKREKIPFPYLGEVMMGFEYVAAILLSFILLKRHYDEKYTPYDYIKQQSSD
jgi:hypothetical protein